MNSQPVTEPTDWPDFACQCFAVDVPMHCMCPDSERALRGYMNGRAGPPMTDHQRAWCAKEIASIEGYGKAEDYADTPDGDLARTVLEAWVDYARDKGLIE